MFCYLVICVVALITFRKASNRNKILGDAEAAGSSMKVRREGSGSPHQRNYSTVAIMSNINSHF